MVHRAKMLQYINKKLFYVIFFHQKLHFCFFGLFAEKGITLATSTLLFMKNTTKDPLLQVDYFLAALCLFLCIFDFFELVYTTLNFWTTSGQEVEENEEIRERISRAAIHAEKSVQMASAKLPLGQGSQIIQKLKAKKKKSSRKRKMMKKGGEEQGSNKRKDTEELPYKVPYN